MQAVRTKRENDAWSAYALRFTISYPKSFGQLHFGIWNSSIEDEDRADEQYIMKHNNWVQGNTLQSDSNSEAFL